MKQSDNPAIQRAMESIAAAIPKAEADPTRPVYHFCPPANWMNDPNGTIYHNGYYHLFYQHNPYGDEWGHMHWGHARSRDLIHWEHLPMALWPSHELGEGHCFSGCAAVGPNEQPMLIYTKVSPPEQNDAKPKQADNEQWLALGDPDWITWEKWKSNPLLALGEQGAPRFKGSWRDPYIFHEADRTFLVLGADREETQEVALYEAEDESLLRWIYRGPLIQQPIKEGHFYECPNFIKLGDKWLLLTSPYDLVNYVVGSFDVETLTFTPEGEGIMDYGLGFTDHEAQSGTVPNYYATNTLFDPAGRCILLAWVRGFAKDRGWNGALALPRVLTLGPDDCPRQVPLPELTALRTQQILRQTDWQVEGEHSLPELTSDTLELQLELAMGSASQAGIKLFVSEEGTRSISIHYDGHNLHIAGTTVPFELNEGETNLALHIFVDKSVLEVFANGGRACITRVIYPQTEDRRAVLFAEGGVARAVILDAWEIAQI